MNVVVILALVSYYVTWHHHFLLFVGKNVVIDVTMMVSILILCQKIRSDAGVKTIRSADKFTLSCPVPPRAADMLLTTKVTPLIPLTKDIFTTEFKCLT